ncbi:MAG: transposase [Saprospiraceae bacterium]|nr:transposase [Candidatus Brachybacter algidus]
MALEAFKETWNAKYPEIAKQWEANWTELMAFMDYGSGIRKMIYTTNSVEALHRQIRKVTKTKGSRVNDKALIKQLYLILMYEVRAEKKGIRVVKYIKDLNQHFGKRFSEHELE